MVRQLQQSAQSFIPARGPQLAVGSGGDEPLDESGSVG